MSGMGACHLDQSKPKCFGGHTPGELAAEFEPTAQSISNWVAADFLY
jgi:hypothetical protein